MSDPKERLIRIMGTFDLATGHADGWDDLLDSLESELRDYRQANKDEFDNWCKESDDGAEERGLGKIEVCPGVTLDQFKAALKESDDGAA